MLVQQALEWHILPGPPPLDPQKVSNALVALVWDRKPDLFEGKLGKPPHKMATAALALATGLYEFPDGGEAQLTVHLALGAVVLDLMTNGPLYDLSGADRWMMDRAQQALSEVAEKRRPLQDAIVGSLLDPRQPDMFFAAKSFAHIALMRMNKSSADFQAVLKTRSQSMRENGATEQQVLSALWGGHYGIDADLEMIRKNMRDYVDAFEATKLATGAKELTIEQGPSKLHMAATKHLALIMADAPGEFERFIAYVKAEAT